MMGGASHRIAETRARDILSRGFASEVTRAISSEPLREEIDLLVGETLEREDAA